MPKRRKRCRSGFTLIEVLVAATIIGLLSAVGYTGMGAVSRNARDSKRKTDLEMIRSSLEMYKSVNQNYPTPNATCVPGLPADYLNSYPSDPKSGAYRYCYFNSDSLHYVVCAHLENSSGADLNCAGTAGICGNGGSEACNFQVTNP